MPDEANPPADTPVEKPKTTTSGAEAVFQNNAWLTAAAVAVYTTKALWVKLREMGLKKGKKGHSKDTEEETTEDAKANLIEDSGSLELLDVNSEKS